LHKKSPRHILGLPSQAINLQVFWKISEPRNQRFFSFWTYKEAEPEVLWSIVYTHIIYTLKPQSSSMSQVRSPEHSLSLSVSPQSHLFLWGLYFVLSFVFECVLHCKQFKLKCGYTRTKYRPTEQLPCQV
jgi:hypothetical protein